MNGDAGPVEIGSVRLANPVMTASGTAGYGTELAGYFDLSTLGAVVVKSLAAFEWPGNPAPRLHPTPMGMLNSVGLQGPGVGPVARAHGAGPGRRRRDGRRQHLGPNGRRVPPRRRAPGRGTA